MKIRDELTHLSFFVKLIREIQKERPGFFSQEIVNKIVLMIATLEKEWAIGVYGKGILGITVSTIDNFVNYRVKTVLDMIGFESPLPSGENPYSHLDAISADNNNSIKTGFFETRLTEYSMADNMEGWDDI